MLGVHYPNQRDAGIEIVHNTVSAFPGPVARRKNFNHQIRNDVANTFLDGFRGELLFSNSGHIKATNILGWQSKSHVQSDHLVAYRMLIEVAL